MNNQKVLTIGLGVIFMAVGFLMFPFLLTICDSLLNYVYAFDSSIKADTFTGFIPVVSIIPLLVLVAFLALSLYTWLSIGKETSSINLSTTLVLVVGIVLIPIGLAIVPVIMDGIATAMLNIATPYNVGTSYQIIIATAASATTQLSLAVSPTLDSLYYISPGYIASLFPVWNSLALVVPMVIVLVFLVGALACEYVAAKRYVGGVS